MFRVLRLAVGCSSPFSIKVSRIFYTKKGRLCVNRPVLCLGVSEKSKISSISTNTAGFYIKKPYILLVFAKYPSFSWAIPHNSKCRYGERGAADAKPKAQIILDAAKVSAASGGNSEPKQGQRSQSARGFCSRSTMRVPQPDIIEHFGNADAVPQPPERCLSRKAGIVRCCLRNQQCRISHLSVPNAFPFCFIF